MKHLITLLFSFTSIVLSDQLTSSIDQLLVDRPTFDPSLKPVYRLLTGGGYTNPANSTQRMLTQPTMPMFDPLTQKILKETKRGLQYVFQTKSPFVAAIAGTGRTAMEASLDNMIEKGDLVLIPVLGYWSLHAKQLAERLGAKVQTIDTEFGTTFQVSEIQEAIKRIRPKIVFLVAGDPYSGIHQDIDGIGDLCIKLNCYVVADVVGPIGIEPVYFDKWKLDVAFCNTQKGLGGIPGLAPMVYSRRAVERVKSRKTSPISYDHDVSLLIQENYWFMNENPKKDLKPSFPILTIQLYPLRESLRLIAEERLANVWARHKNVSRYFANKLASELPLLKFFVKNERDRLTGELLIEVPSVSIGYGIISALLSIFSIHIGTGIGTPALENTLRISLLGPNADFRVADTLVNALKLTVNPFVE